MSDTQSPQPQTEGRVLEAGARLSASMLWQLQREVYNAQGVQAWNTGSVPQSITTSPYTARAYARVVLGYLRDLDAQQNASQPAYILELGAGSGRFGYRFVKTLSRLLQRAALQHRAFTYVMTDVSPSIIDYWQSHPSLRPLVDSGVLDFAIFDAAHPSHIQLTISQKTLRPGEVANPLMVLANYLFDSIPQDCFSVGGGTFYENLVTISSPEDEASSAHPALKDLQVSLESRPTRTDYYADPDIDGILDGYRQRLDNVILLFPIDGMRCVRFFHELSPRGTLFLIGDIGTAREDDLSDRTAGGISADSNFWLSVNFHALGQFIQALGGKVLHPPSRHVNLNISTFILGHSATEFAETALAYDEAIGQAGPDDQAVNIRMLANQAESMNRGQLLAFLRATACDPDYFVRCLPLLLDSLPDVSWPGASDVREVAQEAWEAYYPMGNTDDLSDLPAGLGVLLYTIGDYAEALQFFLRSLELVGMDARTTFNVALCLNRLGRQREAIEWLDRTLELDPSSEKAQAMRAELQPSG